MSHSYMRPIVARSVPTGRNIRERLVWQFGVIPVIVTTQSSQRIARLQSNLRSIIAAMFKALQPSCHPMLDHFGSFGLLPEEEQRVHDELLVRCSRLHNVLRSRMGSLQTGSHLVDSIYEDFCTASPDDDVADNRINPLKPGRVC